MKIQENVVEMLESNEELEMGDKVMLLISLSDCDRVVEELKMKGMMIQAGMEEPSAVTGFAYSVLRLARPDLFEPS